MSKADTSKRKAKIWTVLCLILVIAAAFLLRGVIVQKLYPLDYEELINQYSQEYNIDKHLVCAVIKAESGFEDTAVSHRGAMGLMQIMPDTGSWIAQKIDFDDFESNMLYNPDVNIRLGCWYLHYLDGLFDGDAKKVLAAYNAGPGRVKEWIDGDGVLREIPYPETENYIIKIERNYEIYKGIYKDF